VGALFGVAMDWRSHCERIRASAFEAAAWRGTVAAGQALISMMLKP